MLPLSRWLLLLLLIWGWGMGVGAQTLESALSPGPLTQVHAKWQDECARCHVRFDRAGQDKLCADCHKPVAQDMAAHTGWHGRQPAQACRSCHTDHKGRNARIAPLDTQGFDHRQTDWPLRGAHSRVDCAQCHRSGKAWREAPQDCLACHQKDDKHQGALGKACADCHSQDSWKNAKFDHNSTRFALKGEHTRTACADCHPKARYAGVPTTCVGCHRDDDKHKGQFGERCDSCHDARDWKTPHFNHDTDTRYPLRAKHRSLRCDSCHSGPLYREKNKLGTDCVSCHRQDDPHRPSLGTDCAACHTETGWKQTQRFDHDRSRFPLLGQHAALECTQCHRPGATGTGLVFRDTPGRCIDCHQADDTHAGTLGSACDSCHGERRWKIGRFDHTVTRFALRGAHAAADLACSACHRNPQSYRNTPTTCQGCHDDAHAGQLGPRCETCHRDSRWSDTRFDHNSARFALTGAHGAQACTACHSSPRYRDTPRDCLGCHRDDDSHQARLGSRCDSCHNTRHWTLVSFDHSRQTDWPLTGRHQPLACDACHRQPAPAGRAVAAVGRSCLACHRQDDAHDGQFGPTCERCHQTSDWKTMAPLRPARPASGVRT